MAIDVDIANLALDLIGSEGTLASLEDNTKEARLCLKHYDQSRQSILTKHPWKFAKELASLDTPEVTVPEFGYSNKFLLPGDCLLVRTVNNSDESWEVMGRYIHCDSSTADLQYTKDVTDVEIFHPQFIDVLALHLAVKICYSITQSNERERALHERLILELKRARFSDAVQNSPKQLIATEYDDARLTGVNLGGNFVRDPMT